MYLRLKRIKRKTILCSVKMYYIYVIWARDEDGEEVCYYGHTKDMKERKGSHISRHKIWVDAGRPDKIREADRTCCTSVFVLDMGDWNMDVLHELDCDETEASRVEGNYIRYNKCVNRCIAGRTQAQWYEDNRDVLNAGRRQRHQDQKERDNEKCRQYYQNNKKWFFARNAEKVSCPCGIMVRRDTMARHRKSQKHAKRMQQSTSS